MKHLNRKEYKNAIKEFRKTCPIAQVQHQWVYCKDIYNRDVLIFVHNSIIKRVNVKSYGAYNYYNVCDHCVTIELYGSPAIRQRYDGVDIYRYQTMSVPVNKHNEFEILTGEEVQKKYDLIMNRVRVVHGYKFQDKAND